MNKIFLSVGLLSLLSLGARAEMPMTVKDGKINYVTDERGNRILDYSTCGYRNSSQPIPDVATVVFVPWKAGDNSERIQRAIDYAASLPEGKDGFRGAVLLDKGEFEISRPLRIAASGVVLRGSSETATVIKKTGVDRGALIYVEGIFNPTVTDTLTVTDSYVPVNAGKLDVKGNAKLKAGDRVFVMRPSTAEWIESMGCDIYGGGISALAWKPTDIDMRWDRTVTEATPGSLTLDAPLTMALDSKWAQTTVLPYSWPGRISDIGIENMTLVSDYNTKYPKDEDHCWDGISVANAENCWVRKVDFKHFAGSAVILQPTASKITVEDCIASEPVSEIGGMRRAVFQTLGQQNLFQRCLSKNGINDFSAGFIAPGPNAFVQCEAEEALGFSGSVDAWAPGLLFDVVNIDGNNLTYKNLGQDKNGAGWNTGNSLFWQCTAAEIECYTPAPDAINAAYGCWAQFSGDGEWAQSNNHVQPRSFFYAQLTDRLGSEVPESQSRILPMATNATSSPTVEAAMQLAKEAYIPRLTLEKWIQDAPFTASVSAEGVKSIDDIKFKATKTTPAPTHSYDIANGRMVMDGAVMTGGRHEVPWWNGKIKHNYLPKAKAHVTRFVPSREGLGLTDRIDSTLAYMVENDIAVFDHNYGLWYERRRDDHERIRRRDGDVWAPFYEQPFARSGQGTAWDGLSKYDLTRPNAWYWSRLDEFADKGAEAGKLLFNEHYFQHNILEAGAHWVDSPWRSSNNINATDFPEPVPFAGDKRIFVADMFYDVNHPTRRELHKNYIRMNLDNFADDPNVVHLISAEFTGPQHFVEFWLDEIAAWEKETGKDAKVALSTTKDVQDAILANPKYADVVDIIDIRYWHYKTDGIYAPEGGKNLAPRQHARKMKVGKVTFKEAYKAVSEYRNKYPEKAVTYYAQNYPDMAWAVFMAGGSLAGIPVKDSDFLKAASAMEIVGTDSDDFKLLRGKDGMIVYSQGANAIPIDLPAGKYSVTAYNPKSGESTVVNKSVKISAPYTLDTSDKATVYFFKKL
ncbi:DUF6298 domain-containing protein [uncultured Duncaniella sp.]|uniref:DUF6298 domain-containing protein n=2 Tax=uncultured Duncaniella sp. TaxID=2768039 RepID=UPI00261AD611|nr:DUF6298 domain-containing protein [uncultured Duncaniella sp.]